MSGIDNPFGSREDSYLFGYEHKGRDGKIKSVGFALGRLVGMRSMVRQIDSEKEPGETIRFSNIRIRRHSPHSLSR